MDGRPARHPQTTLPTDLATEATEADAQEQEQDPAEGSVDPQAVASTRGGGGLDLPQADEADVVEQLQEVPLDDDADR
jgi:hypothetical protein